MGSSNAAAAPHAQRRPSRAETRGEVDAGSILGAAGRAVTLWPDDSHADGR